MDGNEKKNKMRKPAFLLGVIIIVLAGFGVDSIASKIGTAVKDAKKRFNRLHRLRQISDMGRRH